ncbi:MAG: hypothetical protein MZV65_40945 [Chromatiales bacterium]|nr:hypothetical protein [Chromatiales bacterium]
MNKQRFLDTVRRLFKYRYRIIDYLENLHSSAGLPDTQGSLMAELCGGSAPIRNTANIVLEEAELAARQVKAISCVLAFDHSEKDINHSMPEHGS